MQERGTSAQNDTIHIQSLTLLAQTNHVVGAPERLFNTSLWTDNWVWAGGWRECKAVGEVLRRQLGTAVTARILCPALVW